jgi:uncharacterized membrane protein
LAIELLLFGYTALILCATTTSVIYSYKLYTMLFKKSIADTLELLLRFERTD